MLKLIFLGFLCVTATALTPANIIGPNCPTGDEKFNITYRFSTNVPTLFWIKNGKILVDSKGHDNSNVCMKPALNLLSDFKIYCSKNGSDHTLELQHPRDEDGNSFDTDKFDDGFKVIYQVKGELELDLNTSGMAICSISCTKPEPTLKLTYNGKKGIESEPNGTGCPDGQWTRSSSILLNADDTNVTIRCDVSYAECKRPENTDSRTISCDRLHQNENTTQTCGDERPIVTKRPIVKKCEEQCEEGQRMKRDSDCSCQMDTSTNNGIRAPVGVKPEEAESGPNSGVIGGSVVGVLLVVVIVVVVVGILCYLKHKPKQKQTEGQVDEEEAIPLKNVAPNVEEQTAGQAEGQAEKGEEIPLQNVAQNVEEQREEGEEILLKHGAPNAK